MCEGACGTAITRGHNLRLAFIKKVAQFFNGRFIYIKRVGAQRFNKKCRQAMTNNVSVRATLIEENR